MEKHLRNSWKLFGTTLMLCCTSLNCLADGPIGYHIALPYIIFNMCGVTPISYCDIPETASYTGSAQKKTICPSGSYVQKCGDYTIGYEWIKAASETSGSSENNNNFDLITNNSNNQYGTSDYFEQMRTFFAGTQTKTTDGTADTSTVKDIRNAMLNAYCDPNSASFTCATCPNNAKIDESSVYVVQKCYKQVLIYPDDDLLCCTTDTSTNCLAENTSLPTSTTNDYIGCSRTRNVNCYYEIAPEPNWQFHTIADCYENEFDDDTGTFVYLPEGASTGSDKCYYGNTVSESDFTTYFMGTEPGSLTVNSSTNSGSGGGTTNTPYNYIPNSNAANSSSSGAAMNSWNSASTARF